MHGQDMTDEHGKLRTQSAQRADSLKNPHPWCPDELTKDI